MLRVSSLAAVMFIAVAAVTSACGQQQAGSGNGSGAASSGAPSVAAGDPGSCRGAKSTMTGHVVTVSASDNGKSFCIKPGTGVLVVLHGTPTRKWSPIHASSGVLVPRANGHLALQLGVTGAYFVATHSGTAVISSARPVCPPSASSGSSPSSGSATTMQCDTELAFHAKVTVQR